MTQPSHDPPAADTLAARAVETCADGIVALQPVRDAGGRIGDFRISLANRAAAGLLAAAPDGLVGRTVHGDRALQAFNGLAPRLADAFETGVGFDTVTPLDGEPARWLRVTASPAGDGLTLTLADVTALSMQSDAAAAADCLAGAIDGLDDGFAVFDAEDRLVLCNGRFRCLFGPGARVLIPGARFADIARALAAAGLFADALGREETWLADRLARFTRHEQPFEQPMADGRWFRVTERRTDDGGTVSLWSDITPLKEAEQRVQEAVGDLSSGIAVWGPDDRLLLCNDEYRGMFPALGDVIRPGVAFDELLRLAVDQGVFDLDGIDPEDWVAHRLQARLKPENSCVQPMADGRWLQVTERRARDGGVVSVRTDITDLKRGELEARREGEYYRRYMDEIFITRSRLEEQGATLVALAEDLFDEKEKAEHASLRKSQFLANLSHELRTPMNAILGFAEILKLEMFGPLGSTRYKQYAEDIHRSGTHLLNLINDVFDMSKIEAGKRELHREPLDVAALADDCLRLVYEMAEDQGVVLINTVGGTTAPLSADRRAFKQCLLNLLTNAIKFTPAGGSVTVSAEAEDGRMTVRVADTGVGIPADDLPKLASPFFRANTPTWGELHDTEGTGLGLALVKSLVEMHQGTLQVDSDVGTGTTVAMAFPAPG